MTRPRINAWNAPDREWEVWNDDYCRTEGIKDQSHDRPWCIWHRNIDAKTTTFATHDEAIDYISKGDWDA